MSRSRRPAVIAACMLMLSAVSVHGAEYRDPAALQSALDALARRNYGRSRMLTLATSPGGRPVSLLEIGPERSERPAVLVLANMEGDCPPASEAALALAEKLLGEWSEEAEDLSWYIVAAGNPDGYARHFASPRHLLTVNDRPVNEDNDEASDEDGPEDLNRDGYITMMRQEHPEGDWLPVEGHSVLLKKAVRAKGEAGVYRLFPEGVDNDSDGKLNEDGPGGANPGWNFPHSFEHYRTENGPWAASENESRGILRFAFDHPEIAMVIVFGRSSTLLSLPEGTKPVSTQSRYSVPEGMARRMGVDPEEEFTLSELVDMARDFTGMPDITEEMVLQFLGVGAATSPDEKDVPYWNEIIERYKKFLKDQGLDAARIDPPGLSPGCVEDWSYFQYGVPTFSMDFWTLPEKESGAKSEGDSSSALTPDRIEQMSNEEFVALGPERIDAFLKASGAPAQYNAQMVIGAVQSGMMTTKKIAEFLRTQEKKEKSGGADPTLQALWDFDSTTFVAWQPYDHPTLGKVEIGGAIPYADRVPPPALVDSLVEGRLPFVRELAGFLPRLRVARVDLATRADGVWKIDAWAVNEGFLPYPTHQGNRCQRPTPAVMEISGDGVEILEGKPRRVLSVLGGSGGTEEVGWLVTAPRGQEVRIRISGASTGAYDTLITLQEGTSR